MENLEPNPTTQDARPKTFPLHTKILLGLVVGMVLGLLANWFASKTASVHDGLDWFVLNITEPAGKIFLRLMFMVVLPLVFSALALAVVEIGDVRRLGKLGLRTLLFTAILSGSAVVIGTTLVDVLKPGRSLSDEKRDQLEERYAGGATANVAQ